MSDWHTFTIKRAGRPPLKLLHPSFTLSLSLSRLSLSHALSLQSPLSVSILRYEQVAAGFDHTVLLRSNRTVVACGRNDYGQCNLASAVPCALKGWWDSSGQCDVPKLNKGLTYTHVAAGGAHTVLRKSDGTVAVCGLKHPVLRKSDGAVFAVLRPRSCSVCGIAPALEDGLTYTHAAAGFLYTVLLQSDGRVVAFGLNDEGQCDVPALEGPRHRRGHEQIASKERRRHVGAAARPRGRAARESGRSPPGTGSK